MAGPPPGPPELTDLEAAILRLLLAAGSTTPEALVPHICAQLDVADPDVVRLALHELGFPARGRWVVSSTRDSSRWRDLQGRPRTYRVYRVREARRVELAAVLDERRRLRGDPAAEV